MAKNILIITSNYTGLGHKSITESLTEQFSSCRDVRVHIADGFELGGNIGLKIGKAYGSVTRNARDLYKLIWDISTKNPSIIRDFTQISIHDSFLKLLEETRPDVVVVVHPSFLSAILNIFSNYGIDIPVVAIVADLVSISPLWADARAEYTICPTDEAKQKCKEFGVPESRIAVTGFPVRAKFCMAAELPSVRAYYRPGRMLECLIMSGGEGSGNLGRLARLLLQNFNCRVKIVAGRNLLLKKRLERTLLEKYPDRAEIFGFTENIQDLMLSSDLAFTRGSPNVMMEAVMCNVPLIITGALPGQEEGNPEYAEKYDLGVVCNDLRKLKSTVDDLLADNAVKLNRLRESQIRYRKSHAARDIANIILNINKNAGADFSGIAKKIKPRDLTGTLLLKKGRKSVAKNRLQK